jgi:hypothetical protein
MASLGVGGAKQADKAAMTKLLMPRVGGGAARQWSYFGHDPDATVMQDHNTTTMSWASTIASPCLMTY